MIMKLKKYFISTVIVLLSFSSLAQFNTNYWMKNLPQSINYNPAKRTECKFYLDLPVLPNFSVNFFNSGFTFNDVFKAHPEIADTFVIDLDGIENALKNKNNINLETEFSLINLGFSINNDMFFTFGINYKVSENFQFPKSLLEIRHGNYREDETPLSFDFGQNLNVYREIALGYSYNVMPELTVGGRLKYLQGMVNINTKSMKIDWYTETHADSMYEWTFDSDFEINASVPIDWEVQYDENGDFESFEFDSTYFDNFSNYSGDLFFPKNSGIAIDLGAEYRLMDRFTFSASLIDLGFISWKTNPAILTQNAEFRFDGIDISEFINGLDDVQNDQDDLGQQIQDDILDTLLHVFNPEIEELKYKSRLNSKIYLGANAALTDWLDFGFLYKGLFFKKNLYSSYTLSANTHFLKGWSYSLSYSLMDGLANNIGMGLSYKVGPFQVYMITDNISVPFWALNGSEIADKWIRNTKRFGFAFGANIIICKENHDIGLMQ